MDSKGKEVGDEVFCWWEKYGICPRTGLQPRIWTEYSRVLVEIFGFSL